jgi:23S rRNA pseudouridine2457 synthase
MNQESENHQHFIVYKPDGYLSQFINNQTTRTNKKLLGELYSFPENTMAIGRLDEDSEGLLLLTTDGKTSETVRSSKIEKEYYVQLDGVITNDAIKKLSEGIEIGLEGKKYTTLPCEAFKLENTPVLPEKIKKIRDERHGPTSWVSITLKEGKFRQVRKMTAIVGFPTLRLVRVRIGTILINSMQPGEVIKINEELIQ